MITILHGDVLDNLRKLPDASVQCVVTSPPYWGLRDYGTAQWDGGAIDCDHLKKGKPTWGEGTQNTSTLSGKPSNDNHERESWTGGLCHKCGATRIDKQIGLEKTPAEYVAKMVEVFREVRRVMRDDGTLWLNLGDSYARAGGWSNNNGLDGVTREQCERARTNAPEGIASQKLADGLKAKDLVGIPWRVAFALQADGWYLRSDIIWSKPNPMPESVTDRPTKAHEYIFLMSKSERYFYDADAIKERAQCEKMRGLNMTDTRETYGDQNGGNSGLRDLRRKVRSPAGWKTGPGSHGSIHEDGREQSVKYNEIAPWRNKRSVWEVATQPYPDAHFATFPEDLVKPCILAGSKAGDVVLDPFGGSGTVGKVALELGRKAILIELNAEYVKLAERRTKTTIGMAL